MFIFVFASMYDDNTHWIRIFSMPIMVDCVCVCSLCASHSQICFVAMLTKNAEQWKQMMNQIGDSKSVSLTPFHHFRRGLILCVAEAHTQYTIYYYSMNVSLCVLNICSVYSVNHARQHSELCAGFDVDRAHWKIVLSSVIFHWRYDAVVYV